MHGTRHGGRVGGEGPGRTASHDSWLHHDCIASPFLPRPCAQLDMLTEAVDVASENPARFNLTVEEIGSRRKWLETTRRQVWKGVREEV